MEFCIRQKYLLFVATALGTFFINLSTAQQYPEGFQIETIITEIEAPAGMVHSDIGISYVWELSGKIWAIENDQVLDGPLLDISDQVGYWTDHGLLSMVLDPDFASNGRFYILYVLDRHFLMNEGSAEYNPAENEYEEATIGRVVRYEVNLENPGSLADTEKVILIGNTPQNGIPITTTSHGLGTLLFGTDKTLFFSVGDGNAPGSDYNGSGEVPAASFDNQALEDGILKPNENVGAFRSQYLNSYAGKVLRIDPETGLGIPSNPFYDVENPDDPISKVWALGFRNPFRMSLIPNSGSSNPADGMPGQVILGDVGDWTWEEINLITDPGQNHGWPLFQGPVSYYMFTHPEDDTPNYDYPLAEGCGQEYLYFQDLIVQPKEDHSEQWESPCGGFINSENVALFSHRRPVLAYRNYLDPPAGTVVPTFDENGDASHSSVTNPELNIEGAEDFSGISSVAGVFYSGNNFPSEYQNAYFQADFSGWFRVFHFNEFNEIHKMELWDSDIGNVVHISQNPADGNIYLVGLFPGEIRRISYAGNLKPVIEVTPDTVYGTSPLIVQFDASESYDPEGTELTFSWDFGDGTQGNGSNIVHEFNAASSAPESFEVSLVVTDADGKFAEKNLLVSVNNTPPMAEITGFEENYLYPIVGLSDLNLEAEFWDNESSAEELNIDWKVYLHHNTHYHLEYTYHEQQQNTTIQPLGCGIETFWYRVDLQVTDPQGLQYKVSREVFPDCSGSSDTNDSTTVSESFTIYPNPANDLVTLQFTKPLGDWLNIELYSIHGHLVKSYSRTPTEGTTKNIISVSGLPAGIYILVCETPQWQQTQKISVVKN